MSLPSAIARDRSYGLPSGQALDRAIWGEVGRVGLSKARPLHNPLPDHSASRAQRGIPLGSIEERFLAPRTPFGMTEVKWLQNVGAPTFWSSGFTPLPGGINPPLQPAGRTLRPACHSSKVAA
jgi:hypothetical protein